MAKEEFFYSPYLLTFKKEYLKYFQTNQVDSVVMVFLCSGIFNNQYEYRIHINNSIKLFRSNGKKSYWLSIHDILNSKKNRKLIQKLGVPYIYSFYQKNPTSVSSYHSWDCLGLEKIKIKGTKRVNKLDYFDYRLRFWDSH